MPLVSVSLPSLVVSTSCARALSFTVCRGYDPIRLRPLIVVIMVPDGVNAERTHTGVYVQIYSWHHATPRHASLRPSQAELALACDEVFGAGK